MFIPVTLLGNDPDPIVHWYFTSSPVAEHVNVAVCVRFTLCGDGGVVNVGAVSKMGNILCVNDIVKCYSSKYITVIS